MYVGLWRPPFSGKTAGPLQKPPTGGLLFRDSSVALSEVGDRRGTEYPRNCEHKVCACEIRFEESFLECSCVFAVGFGNTRGGRRSSWLLLGKSN